MEKPAQMSSSGRGVRPGEGHEGPFWGCLECVIYFDLGGWYVCVWYMKISQDVHLRFVHFAINHTYKKGIQSFQWWSHQPCIERCISTVTPLPPTMGGKLQDSYLIDKKTEASYSKSMELGNGRTRFQLLFMAWLNRFSIRKAAALGWGPPNACVQ